MSLQMASNEYLRWNDGLAANFFNPEMAGKPVYFYVTNEVVSEVGGALSSPEAGFVAAVEEGPPWVTRDGLCQRALQAAEGWGERELVYPPYLGYLGVFVLAAGVEGDFAAHAYYPRLRELLGYPPGGMLPSFHRMLELWDDLERWSSHDIHGELGVFTARIAGGWIHVGLPVAQTILTEEERHVLPAIFLEGELDPTSLPPDGELGRVLRTHGAGRLRRRTLRLLKSRTDEELYGVLLDAVGDELARWDGLVGADDEAGRSRIHHGSLRLSLHVEPVLGRVRAEVRCALNAEFPDGRLLLTGPDLPDSLRCDHAIGKWSAPLVADDSGAILDAAVISWSSGTVLRDGTGKWEFRMPGRDVRVFIEGTGEGLPGLVEVHQLPGDRPFYLAYDFSVWGGLEAWVETDCSGFTDRGRPEGLPPDWRFASIDRASDDALVRDRFPVLSFPRQIRMSFRGGIRRVRGSNTFFAFAPPELELSGGDGSEQVICNGRPLVEADMPGRFRLPPEAPVDSRVLFEVLSTGETVRRQSIYLTEDFPWRRTPISQFDKWGRSSEASDDRSAIAGASVLGMRPSTAEFTTPFLLAPELHGYRGDRVFLLGRIPGQVLRWPEEELSADWNPVWAVPLRRRGFAVYVGASLDDAVPEAEETHVFLRTEEWKDVLWNRRRRIQPPPRGPLRQLWDTYVEVARRV